MSKRIFWLGMHKVLRTTELPQLRAMGYEVFSPAYISPVYDQSADRSVDATQHTTLPLDIFQKLLAHDFFYTKVPSHIAEILNEYFDCVIVTINPDWLRSIIEVFPKQVIYRVYGQPYSLSAYIRDTALWQPMVTHGNIQIVPFATESVEKEHPWFHDLCVGIVPYQLPDDVFDYSGSWVGADHNRTIATSIPNIENPHYGREYAAFNAEYPHRVVSIYGPQRSIPSDPRIVGALRRDDFLGRLRTSAGFLYNFRDDVCYLTPIESMEIGAPVIYAPGSLLHRFYGENTPGLIANRLDAERKMKFLLDHDKGFVSEVIAAQEPVRQRYDRAVVQPLFEAKFRELLDEQPEKRPLAVRPEGAATITSQFRPVASQAQGDTVAVLLHIEGLIDYAGGRPAAFEGIPRVVEAIIDTLSNNSDLRFIVTCTINSISTFFDFFHEYIITQRVELMPIVGTDIPESYIQRIGKIIAVNELNRREDVKAVLVPHYYLFPECLLLKKPVTLYLPDYFPHLMPEAVFDVSRDKDIENKQVGVAIAKKAQAILTNSEYTRGYLPAAGFVTTSEVEKVIVAPLPLLGSRGVSPLSQAKRADIQALIGGRRFLFYPTANRPNKNMAFFLQVLATLRRTYPDLVAVLTCDLRSVPGVEEACDAYGLRQHLIFQSRIGDDALAWYYQNAAALCLTSSVEGNFPPQVLEALSYDCPVVCTRLPTITEILPKGDDGLLLCNERDLADFTGKVEIAISSRATVLERQSRVLESLRQRNSPERFTALVSKALGRPADTGKEAARCA